MENECIQAKVLSGSYTLKLKEGGKSVVWTTFREIIDENGIKIQNYVACGECKKIYHFSSHKSGTSNLLKHKCIGTEGKSIRKSMLPKKTLKPVTKDLKDLVMKSVVNFILKDVRPYEAVIGQGILDLAQCLVNVGAQHGTVDAALLLPHPIPLFCNVSCMANLTRKNLIPELKRILGSVGGAVVLDFWSNDLHKIDYLGLSVRYLKNFALTDRVLCTVELDGKGVGSEEIRFAVRRALGRFELQFLYDRLVYVTDRIVTDFESRYLICSVSMLNTVLDHTIKPDNLGENVEVWDIITTCMTLSTYVRPKGSGVQITLNENSKTIWNNKIQMISLIYEQWDQIVEILSEQDEMNHLELVNKDVLRMLVKFLTPFQQALDELKTSTNPTLHLVLVWYYRLILQLKPNYSDSATLSLLKETAMLYLEEKMLIDILHKVAVFLHPKLKSLKILKNDVERQEVYSEVRKMIAHRRSNDSCRSKPDDFDRGFGGSVSSEPLSKKIKSEPVRMCSAENSRNVDFNEESLENDSSLDLTDLYNCNNSFDKILGKERKSQETLSDFEDSCSDDEPEVDEVGKYIALKVGKSEDFDLVNWWKSHEAEFPHLCKIAQFIFSIPASIGVEENSSVSESLFKARRTSLNPDTVDDILFLYGNLDK